MGRERSERRGWVRANKGTVDALTLRSPRLSLTHYAPSLLPVRPEDEWSGRDE